MTISNQMSTNVFSYLYDDIGNPNIAHASYRYDGWNRIGGRNWTSRSGEVAEVSTNYWVWGLDLSGTLQGAGGVGGLLTEITMDGARYPFCDGNGNITDWVDSDGELVAHHEYDPYGNEMTGNLPTSYGFSSKPFDSTLGLYYYGYRFYRPDSGRWINRDPIGENGARNMRGEMWEEQDAQLAYLSQIKQDVQFLRKIELTSNLSSGLWSRRLQLFLEKENARQVRSDSDTSAEFQLYSFLNNNSLNYFDPFGLLIGEIGTAAACAALDGPSPIADIIAIGILICCLLDQPDDPPECPPCEPPVGSIGYRGPDSHSHWPFRTGETHYHLYSRNQSPWPSCRCFWSKIKGSGGVVSAPPLGSLPM